MREGFWRKAVHAAIGFCIALVLTNIAQPSVLRDQMGGSHLKGAVCTLDLVLGWAHEGVER